MVIQVYGPRYPNKKTVTINPIWFHLAANVKLIISSNIRRACTVYYGAACPSCLFFLLLTEPLLRDSRVMVGYRKGQTIPWLVFQRFLRFLDF